MEGKTGDGLCRELLISSKLDQIRFQEILFVSCCWSFKPILPGSFSGVVLAFGELRMVKPPSSDPLGRSHLLSIKVQAQSADRVAYFQGVMTHILSQTNINIINKLQPTHFIQEILNMVHSF